MEIVKTYKVKKTSRNKLSKKQLNELKTHKYVIFERSWANVMERVNYMKAVMRPEMNNVHKYSWNRLKRLFDYLQSEYVNEMKQIYDKADFNHLHFATDKKARNTKISLTK